MPLNPLKSNEPEPDNDIYEIFLVTPDGNIEKKVASQDQLIDKGLSPPYEQEVFIKGFSNGVERLDPEYLEYDVNELEDEQGFIPRREWITHLKADDLERLFTETNSSLIGDLDSRQIVIIIILITVAMAAAFVMSQGLLGGGGGGGSSALLLGVLSYV